MSDDKYSWQIGATPPSLDDHSAAKHEVLRQYVRTYVEVLTANPCRDVLKLTIIDGFAGGGQYMRGGILVPGSPLIVLDEIKAAAACVNAQRTKPISIDSKFVFVEHKNATFIYVQDEIQPGGKPLRKCRIKCLLPRNAALDFANSDDADEQVLRWDRGNPTD